MKKLVISDIHGHLNELKMLLKKIDKMHDDYQLILLGDYIHKGTQNLETLYFVKELVECKGAIALKGNHEVLFLENRKECGIDWNDALNQTNPSQKHDEVIVKKKNEKEERKHSLLIDWLEKLPLYYEDVYNIYVHASVNLNLRDWKNSSESDFLWNREPFFSLPNDTGKQIIFGHTPSVLIKPNKWYTSNIWYNKEQGKLGIDGGITRENGGLNGILLEKDNILEVITIEVVNHE